MNRRVAVGATEGLWQELLSSCCPSRWGFFCPSSSLCRGSGQWKLWAQVRYLADFLAGYEGDSSACFSHCFFFLSFSSSLPGLEPGQNPWCLVSGPNGAQVLGVSLEKIQWEYSQQVRGGFVWIQRDRTPRVWAIRGEWPWNVMWLSGGWVIS